MPKPLTVAINTKVVGGLSGLDPMPFSVEYDWECGFSIMSNDRTTVANFPKDVSRKYAEALCEVMNWAFNQGVQFQKDSNPPAPARREK